MRVGLWLVVLGALVLRLLWLEADAATTLTWSGAPFTDEGLYSHAARNRVLFGVWRTNEWDNRLVSPLFDAAAYAMYTLFGVGFVQIRLINVTFAILALLLFWLFLRRDLGERWALLGVVVWGFDYAWFQYSRLGLLEPGMVFWLVAAGWCWRVAVTGRKTKTEDRRLKAQDRRLEAAPLAMAWIIGCGICVSVAWVWKSLALVFVPAPVLALWLIGPIRASWRAAGGYLLGLLLGLGLYVGLWYLPQRTAITAYNQFYAADRVPASVAEAGRVMWNNLRAREVWGQTPVLLLAGGWGAISALAALVRRRLPPAVALCLAWLACGGGLLLLPYSPSRYYMLLLPALAGLAVWGCQSVGSQTARWLPPVIIGGGLLWSGWWYGQWVMQRRTTLIEGGRVVQALVPDGEMVLGVAACGVSLANTLPCAPPFAGLANDAQPVETLGARYALVEDSRDDFMRRFYGPLLARSTPLQRLALGPRRVTLYRLAGASSQTQGRFRRSLSIVGGQ